MLTTFLKERRVRRAPLSRAMGMSQKSLKRYEKIPSCQVATLWRLCHPLRHNFFADIAAQLPADFTSNVPVDTTLQNKIAVLEAQLAKVTAERDVLLRVLRNDD